MGETKTARPSLKNIIDILEQSGFDIGGIADDGTGASLDLGDGTMFNTHKLEGILARAPRDRWRGIIGEFIRPLTGGLPDIAGMGEVEMLRTVHSRLLWELPNFDGVERYRYARRFGPFHEVLQVRLGAHLATLADCHVEGRDLDLLFDAGRTNTEKLECRIDVITNPDDGSVMWWFHGDSNIVSSKLPYLPEVLDHTIGAIAEEDRSRRHAPRGYLFLIPNCREILVANLAEAGDADNVWTLMKLAADVLDSTGMPGAWFMHRENGGLEIERVVPTPNPLTGEIRFGKGTLADLITELSQ